MIRLSIFAIAALAASPVLAAEPSAGSVTAAYTPALLPSAAASPLPTQVVQNTPVKKAKIRCRTDYEIGSLVKRTRRCGDAATWGKSDDAAREQARLMSDQKGTFNLPGQ